MSMYCSHCGVPLPPQSQFCPCCGAKNESTAPAIPFLKPDIPSSGLKVLCFFFPFVGLILYLVQRDETPISANAYGKMALIGFCVWVAIGIIIFVLLVLGMFSLLFSFSDYSSYYPYY